MSQWKLPLAPLLYMHYWCSWAWSKFPCDSLPNVCNSEVQKIQTLKVQHRLWLLVTQRVKIPWRCGVHCTSLSDRGRLLEGQQHETSAPSWTAGCWWTCPGCPHLQHGCLGACSVHGEWGVVSVAAVTCTNRAQTSGLWMSRCFPWPVLCQHPGWLASESGLILRSLWGAPQRNAPPPPGIGKRSVLRATFKHLCLALRLVLQLFQLMIFIAAQPSSCIPPLCTPHKALNSGPGALLI